MKRDTRNVKGCRLEDGGSSAAASFTEEKHLSPFCFSLALRSSNQLLFWLNSRKGFFFSFFFSAKMVCPFPRVHKILVCGAVRWCLGVDSWQTPQLFSDLFVTLIWMCFMGTQHVTTHKQIHHYIKKQRKTQACTHGTGRACVLSANLFNESLDSQSHTETPARRLLRGRWSVYVCVLGKCICEHLCACGSVYCTCMCAWMNILQMGKRGGIWWSADVTKSVC